MDRIPVRGSSFYDRHRVAVRTGLIVGQLQVALLSAWLVIANRLPVFEQFAAERNFVAAVAGVVFAAMPIVWFFRSAPNILIAGGISWSLISLCYFGWSMYFERLVVATHISALQFFVLGLGAYGAASALVWVVSLLFGLRRAAPVAEATGRPLVPR
jgi:hypothetical protein